MTVGAILEAAREVFEREGFDAASINGIAERAGVSIGSLYQYFPSKEAVLVALIEAQAAETMASLEASLEAARDMPLAEAVRAIVASFVRAHRAPIHGVLAHGSEELGRLRRLQESVDARAGAAIARFLSHHREAIRAPNIELAAFLLVRTVDRLVHAAMDVVPSSLESEVLTEEITALILGYLKEERAPLPSRVIPFGARAPS